VVKAPSAGVCAANGKLEAGARQRITAPGRRAALADPFDVKPRLCRGCF
jgi:hypothetical protein